MKVYESIQKMNLKQMAYVLYVFLKPFFGRLQRRRTANGVQRNPSWAGAGGRVMGVHNCKYCKAECGFGGENRQRDCKGYIPMTNADRIRAMSDEKLACFLCDMISNCDVRYCPGAETCGTEIGKAGGLQRWLKQTTEESHDR